MCTGERPAGPAVLTSGIFGPAAVGTLAALSCSSWPPLPLAHRCIPLSSSSPSPLPSPCSYSGSTLTKLIATVMSGVAIGLTAAALQLAVDVASRRRNALLDRLLDAPPPPEPGSLTPGSSSSLAGLATSLLLSSSLPRFFGALAGLSMGIVLLLTLVVALWAPKAAGGGVALVMAFLNGACLGWGRWPAGCGGVLRHSCIAQLHCYTQAAVLQCRLVTLLLPAHPCVLLPSRSIRCAAGNAIQGLLGWQVYVTKAIGTALARLAGLALGIEGERGCLHAAPNLGMCNAAAAATWCCRLMLGSAWLGA